MRIELKQTPEQVELFKAVGSKDRLVSQEANAALTSAIGPVVQEILPQASTSAMIYKDITFNADESPSMLLDPYYDKEVGYIHTWSQQMAGGLPTNKIEGGRELKFDTYRIDSAVSFPKKYARRARFDVLNGAIARTVQEVLIKQETNRWAVIATAAAGANSRKADHILGANTAGQFGLDDINRLMTQAKLTNTSFADGTSINFGQRRLTDLVVSPNIMEEIRGFVYNPLNTRAVPNTDESTAVALPDSIREQIYRSAGAAELFGIALTEIVEVGVGEDYAVLFDNAYSGSSPTFDSATQEVVFGFDLTQDGFFRPVAVDSETGSQFILVPDDQFVTRQDEAGWYGSVEEGAISIQGRNVFTLIV